jgi:hypothetical protein
MFCLSVCLSVCLLLFAAHVAGKRQLLRNSRDMWKVGLPILVMGVVVIIVYATSVQQLGSVSLADNMSLQLKP